MNRERFQELKEKTRATIAEKNAEAAELQKVIEECDQMISANRAAADQAEANSNPEEYQKAYSLLSMYCDRRVKTQKKQQAAIIQPVIGGDDYTELRNFIQEETAQIANEEMAEIWEHLSAILSIRERFDSYRQEISNFASECEVVNKASFTGKFNTITISRPPEHWFSGIQESARFFRPKN